MWWLTDLLGGGSAPGVWVWLGLAGLRAVVFYLPSRRPPDPHLDRKVVLHLLLSVAWFVPLFGLAELLAEVARVLLASLVAGPPAVMTANGTVVGPVQRWWSAEQLGAAGEAVGGAVGVSALTLVIVRGTDDLDRPDVRRAFVALRLLACGTVAVVWGAANVRLAGYWLAGAPNMQLANTAGAVAVAVPATVYHLWLLLRDPPAPGDRDE